MPASCVDGDIRLVGGETEREGQMEVCLDQRWGTVNGDGWSSVDAQVVCRQLGYLTPGNDILLCFIHCTSAWHNITKLVFIWYRLRIAPVFFPTHFKQYI